MATADYSAHTAPPAPRVSRSGLGTWLSVLLSALLLVALAIFVAQNMEHAAVNFLGWHASVPVGVCMILSAIAGALITAFMAGVRGMRMRRAIKKLV